MAESNHTVSDSNMAVLLEDLTHDVTDVEVLKQIEINRIQPGRYQPRKVFSDESLTELAQSIAEHGIIQPLVVRPVGRGKYEIIAGERRFRAGKSVGLVQMPCVVKNYSDQQALAVALIENLQRADLNILEVAVALRQLIQDFGLTHEKAAQLVGRSRSAVTNILRLLDLNSSVQEALRNGEIEMGHARALHSLNDSQQKHLLAEAVERGYSVRQIEARVRRLHRQQIMSLDSASCDHFSADKVNIEALENRLSRYLGYQVLIEHGKNGQGKVILKYGNLDELDGILAKWGFNQSE